MCRNAAASKSITFDLMPFCKIYKVLLSERGVVHSCMQGQTLSESSSEVLELQQLKRFEPYDLTTTHPSLEPNRVLNLVRADRARGNARLKELIHSSTRRCGTILAETKSRRRRASAPSWQMHVADERITRFNTKDMVLDYEEHVTKLP